MLICPCDLEPCNRRACASGLCKKSGESKLLPCGECGVLVMVRAVPVCIERRESSVKKEV
jgi:hypothetical protein